ncbi:MAG: prolyl oligopeptidase family serine peptidase [Gammaproteobacteria bacterium]|nr:prolyl oligopeptidase family serine peptidase [Gammaproteobacteria bacterium]
MTRRGYGTWPSPIDAEVVTAASRGYGALAAHGDALYWIESRPEEGGRGTLIHHEAGRSTELTPAPLNPRSSVHEYGGGAFCVAEGTAYFVNFADQDIYAVAVADRRVQRITNDSDRYADLTVAGDALLAVRERHRPDATEPDNDLVRIDIATGNATVLHAGHDFYAAPRLDDGARRVAFLVWDHPNMPWDGTQLVVAEYDGKGLRGETVVAGGATESIVQPVWHGERLLFASDLSGYWNLHAYDQSGVYCVLADDAEYAGPAWQFAASYFVPVGPGHVVARRVEDAQSTLVVIDVNRSLASPLHDGCCSYAALTRTPAGVAFVAGYPDQPGRVEELKLDSRTTLNVAMPDAHRIPMDVISVAETITFPSTDDASEAHAYFYPPRNGAHDGLAGELPPLLITTHGGPTSSASPDLNWNVQYYTSRGWAVADVNYGGSTGYGRDYRMRLNGRWGQLDIADCVACVRHLVAAGRVDPARVAIRGGSAGGYTTLAALAFTDVFRAGASHYGVGDLVALDRDTHKFESRYLGTLIGDADALRDRSPVNHVDRLNCPVIFFQGTEDRIVPPNQAEAMRDVLVGKGIPVAYEVFDGEGHGFRRAENRRRVIEAEYAFFARVFAIDAPGLVDVAIANTSALKS